jgi:hypothetical protein
MEQPAGASSTFFVILTVQGIKGPGSGRSWPEWNRLVSDGNDRPE